MDENVPQINKDKAEEASGLFVKDFWLTQTEIRILNLIFEGNTHSKVGLKMGIARPTVYNTVQKIYRKTKLPTPHSKDQLIEFLRWKGFIE